jgi:CubicO group peptidase (beta-lactamase class C family)
MTHRGIRRSMVAILTAICASQALYAQSPRPKLTPTEMRRLTDTVQAVLDRAVADSAFPGAIAVVEARGFQLTIPVGHLTLGDTTTVTTHTLWDMASLTKVVAATTAIMQLTDQKKIDVDQPVQRYLPDWIGPGKAAVTVRHLLTHSSGLPSFKPYDRITTNRDSIDKLMFGTPLDSAPGRAMIYSDIGGYLLGKIVERVSGKSLDTYTKKMFEGFGMNETMFLPPASLLPRIAPTEFDSLRGGIVRGKVHDERAYYLGGVSGHAGLFSTAADMMRYAGMLLHNDRMKPGDRRFKPATLALFTSYADSAFSNRGLGWQKPTFPGMKFSSGGPWGSSKAVPSTAYGHTGFTGTSIIIDPTNDLYIVLLSNRVNPTRNNSKIGGVRTRLTDAVYSIVAPPPSR